MRMNGRSTAGMLEGQLRGLEAKPERWTAPLLLLGLLLVVELDHNSGVLGTRLFERQEMVAYGVTQAVLFTLITYALLLRHLHTRAVVVLVKEHRQTFGLLLVWMGVCCVALLEGFLFGNDTNLMLGDFWKFLWPAACFAVAYFTFANYTQVEYLLKAAIILLGLFLFFDLVRHWNDVLGGARLTTTAALSASVCVPLQLFFFEEGRSGRGFRSLNTVVLILGILATVLSQARLSAVNYVCGAVCYFVVTERLKLRAVSAVALALIFVFGFLFVGEASMGGAVEGFYQRWLLVHPQYSFVRGELELGAGSRLHEIESILLEFWETPEKLFLGTGLGSTTKTWVISWVSFWGPTHYIHSTAFEVLFRTGLAGFLPAVAICIHFLRRAVVLRRRWRLANVALAAGLQLVVNSLINNTLVFPFTFTFLCFAALLALEREETRKKSFSWELHCRKC